MAVALELRSGLENRLQRCLNALTAHQSTIVQQQRQLESLEVVNSTLSHQLEAAETELESLRESDSHTLFSLLSQYMKSRKLTQKLESLKTESVRRDEFIRQLVTKLQDKDQEVQQEDDRKTVHLAHMIRENDPFISEQEKGTCWNTDKTTLEMICRQAKRKSSEKSNEIHELKLQIADFERVNNNLTLQLSTAHQATEIHSSAVETMQKELETLNQLLTQTNQELTMTQAKCTELEQERIQYKEKKEEASRQKQEEDSEKEKEHAMLTEYRRDNERFARSIQLLKEKLLENDKLLDL